MIDFVSKRHWFYGITISLVVITIVALVAPERLPWGLEFSSGSSLTVDFIDKGQDIEGDDVRTTLAKIGLEDTKVQETGENSFFIRTTRVEDDLVTLLNDRFGVAEANTLDGPSNMAAVISFLEPVAIDQLRGKFSDIPADLVIAQTGDGGYFLSGSGVSEEEVDATISRFESEFGAIARLDYRGAENMAVTLDFGPAVPVDDFEEILENLEGEFESLSTSANAYLVVGRETGEDTRTGFVGKLEELFGRADVTSYSENGDMALLITFAEGAEIADIRNELFTQSFFTTTVLPAGDKTFVFLAKDIPEERQSDLLEALQESIGALTHRDFDFERGIAVQVDFGQTATPKILRNRIGEIEPGTIAIQVAEHTFFIGAEGASSERQDQIVNQLEESFGLAKREQFDFNNSFALRISFVDPIRIDNLIATLSVLPLTDAFEDRAKIQHLGDNRFLLIAAGMDLEEQNERLDALESQIGELNRTPLNPEADLAVVLDFGPSVTQGKLRDAVSDLKGDILTVESMATGEFLLIGSNFDLGTSSTITEAIESLRAALETKFGASSVVKLGRATDVVVRLAFDESTSADEVRSTIRQTVADQNIEINFAVAAPPTGDDIFLVLSQASQENQAIVFDAIEELDGAFDKVPLDRARDVALTLDFGPVVDQTDLESAIKELGFESVHVSLLSDGFFLGGLGIAQTRRASLLEALEARFGGAVKAPFDRAANMALIVSPQDIEQTTAVVSDTVIVQKLGPNRFFLGELGVSDRVKADILSALQNGLGPVRQASFDFTRNVASVISFNEPVDATQIGSTLEPFNYTNVIVEQRDDNTYFIRSNRPSSDQKNKIVSALEASFGEADRKTLEFAFVDAEIARRSVLNTFYAVLGATAGILLYVWWAFRRTPKPFRYGVAAVIGLLHDVTLVLGAFGIMAKFRGVEIDSLMIIGILAVIGYSVNNTIVVLDRIRENLARHPTRGLESAVNISLNETLSRNLNTTVTTAVAILAVLLFGGDTISNFMLVLLIGILAGTYSSLFLAANILVSWEKGELRLRLPFFRRSSLRQPTR